mmetsp:Transcript_13486/g.19437  ORF Transcript_13486/g.19437 Transcript_13486/m.19437 type:complete len:85 (-) Transcript_13486:434-688(-)
MMRNQQYTPFNKAITCQTMTIMKNSRTTERLGSQIGQNDTRIQQLLQQLSTNPTQPMEAESSMATRKTKDGYLVVCFLMNNDKH